MKNYFLLFFLFAVGFVSGQTMDHIQFDYDAAGNQRMRYLVDIDPGRQSNQLVKDIKTLIESDLIKADIYDDIKYYPNPVKSELYVKWVSDSKNYVTTIEIYSMNGQLMKSYPDLKKVDIATIDFQNSPQGFYNLILVYNNGEKKTLKIVKH